MSNLATISNNILADSGIDDINVVVTTGSYANPPWITSLAWTKITGAPANIVTGTGNNNYIAKFTSTGSTIGNSLLQSTSDEVFIIQENSNFGIDAQGAVRLGFVKKGGFQPFVAYAADPFTIRSTSGTSIAAGNTFATQFSMAINGDATFVGNLQSNGVLRIDGTTDPNTTNAAYFWNAAGLGPTISGLKFQVRVGATQTTRLFLSELGYLGVNTITPQSNFVVSNDAGTQSIELNQLTSVSRIFAFNRAAGTFSPLALNDGGGVVLIGTVANNGSLLQVNGEASFGAATEKLSMSSQSLGFNRRVSNGVIYDSSAFAYQFQHTQSTSSGSDYLALQVYNTVGGSVATTALVVNGVGNVLINTGADNSMGAKLQVNGSGTFKGLLYVDKSGAADQPNVRLRTATDSYQTQWGVGQISNSLNFGLAYFNGSSWSNPYVTILTSGETTFSSSVTSTGLIVNGTEIYMAPANYASGGFTRLLGRNSSTGRIEGMSAADLQAFIGLGSYVPYTGANQNVNLGANSLQVNQKIGTIDDQGIFLRGIGDATHKIYYKVSIPANIWEVNANILFQNYNSGSPFTIFTFNTSGNFTALGSVTGSGAKSQLIADGGASAGAEILLRTSLTSNPTLRRNWAIATEDQVEGDFAIRSSTTAGGTPVTTRLSILRDGMVGINMTTPIYQLDVTTANYKSFRIQSSDDALITMGSTVASSQFYSIGVSSSVSGQGANLFWIGTSTNNPSGTLTKNFTLNATGNVGINTTTLGERFNINGYIGLQRSASQIWHYGVDSTNSLEFVRSGIATRMILSSDGNLGLGTVPSPWTATHKVFQFGAVGSIETDDDAVALSNNRYFDGVNKYRVNDFASILVQVNGEFRFLTAPSGTAGNAITFNTAMILNASGNLGIGMTPATKLDVSGVIRASSYVNSYDGTRDIYMNPAANF